MSGIVAILHRDGSPVDPALLRQLTDFLAFRGPDAQQIWWDGPVGLGHALLRTTWESRGEREPMSLDGQVWIVADARVDAREELCETLARIAGDGTVVPANVPDVELILRAYLAWGEDCIEHLLGDFSFVVWDGRRQRLFAARDHFGVKPMFYAQVRNVLLLSNTLDCLRLHPSISEHLDDRFIGDFLLSGISQDRAATVWSDIGRLPAAHTLSCVPGQGVRLRRYWTLPMEEPLRYRRTDQYIEEFRWLLRQAVRDRLRTDRISISLSGGLDSSSVAATTSDLYGRDAAADTVRGVTIVFDRLIPDRERHYSSIVARHLGIPIEYIVGEDYRLFESIDDGSLASPEPAGYPLELAVRGRFRLAAPHSRVLLTGEGGDPGLIPSLGYYRGWRLPALVSGTARYLLSQGRMPRIGFRLTWNRWRGKTRRPMPYPVWLQPDFETRAGLRDRWQEINREADEQHPDRPAAYASLISPLWDYVFNFYEPTKREEAVEARHPLFDLRLVRFFLRLPTLPWCADKELIRLALHGALPKEILRRPKAPLAGDPVEVLLRQPESRWVDDFEAEPELSAYVARHHIPRVAGPDAPGRWEVDLMPRSLNSWLRRNARGEKSGENKSFLSAKEHA